MSFLTASGDRKASLIIWGLFHFPISLSPNLPFLFSDL